MTLFTITVTRSKFQEPIVLAARSEPLVCGRSISGIAYSNPAEVMDVYYACCVLVGKGLCDGPIRRPEESNQMCVCVLQCDKVQQ